MLYAAIALLALVLLLFAWGVARLRRGTAQAFAAARAVDIDRVPSLVEECIAGFAGMGRTLALDDPDAAAALLDQAMSRDLTRLKLAFARPGFDWYFVLPLGAALGELLRLHAGGRWEPADGGGLCIVLPLGEGTATAHPFEKIAKHGAASAPGDLLAYLAAARGFQGAGAPAAADA